MIDDFMILKCNSMKDVHVESIFQAPERKYHPMIMSKVFSVRENHYEEKRESEKGKKTLNDDDDDDAKHE